MENTLILQEVDELPKSRWGIKRSKYAGLCEDLADKKSGTVMKINYGKRHNVHSLYNILWKVSRNMKLNNLSFHLRGKDIFCVIK